MTESLLTPPPILSAPPTVPPTSNRHPILLAIFILAALLLIYPVITIIKIATIPGFLKPYPPVPVLTPPPLVSTTPTPASDVTANWKTYTNIEYGFEFEYPASWKTSEIDTSYYPKAKYWLRLDEKGESFPWTSGMDVMFYPWMDHPIFAIRGINIIVTKDDSIEIDREGYNCNLETEGCVFLFKFSPTVFNGIPARLTVAHFPDICADPENRASCGGDNEIIPYSYIAFKKDNYTWVISYDHSDFYQNHNPLYDQILSTFRFLDPPKPSAKEDRFLDQPTPTTNPEGKFCGGIAANLPQNQCPNGYYCQLDGNYPDASGKCVRI